MQRFEIPGGARFITFSCDDRLPFFQNAAICRVFTKELESARRERGLELFAWVVMPEHVHLLCRGRSGVELSPILKCLKGSVGRKVVRRWRELRAPILKRITTSDGRARFWLKGGGFDRNVRDSYEFSRELVYIHQNPVSRGLVERPEDWEWSSVHWWDGRVAVADVVCDPLPGEGRSWERWSGYK